MSTRSLICMQLDDDKYKKIYCHSDGYLTYNGAMLLDHYSDREKLEKLLNLGDISCLNIKVDPDPSKPHSFDYKERQEDVVVAYGRDRDEKNTEAKICTLDELKNKFDWIEYIYIFTKDDKWKYYAYPFDIEKDVKEELDRAFKNMGIKRPKDEYGYFTEEEIARIKKKQESEM